MFGTKSLLALAGKLFKVVSVDQLLSRQLSSLCAPEVGDHCFPSRRVAYIYNYRDLGVS